MTCLLELLHEAADGRFPAPDGTVSIVPSWRADLSAVVSFTAHVVIVTNNPRLLDGVRADAYGAALHPEVLAALAGHPASIGVIDATLATRGTGMGGGADALVQRRDLDEHPRVVHARAIRDHVITVYGCPAGRPDQGLVTLGIGVAGRTELSVELIGEQPPGTGRHLIRRALDLVSPHEFVFAAVAPGNARSLRAFLALGFTPIASEVIIHHL